MPFVLRWALVFVIAASAPAVAQPAAPPPAFASPFVPAGHWAHEAVRRVIALGLSDGEAGWADGSLTRRAAAAVLRGASGKATERRPDLAALVGGYWRRFEEEFPATARAMTRDSARLALRGEGAAGGAFVVDRGRLGTGFAEWRQRGGTGPVAAEELPALAGELTWAASLSPSVAVDVTARRDADWSASEAYVYAAHERVGLWAGRRAFRYGPGVGGGVIVNATSPFNGAGIVVEPSHLPSVLRYLGRVSAEGMLSRVDSSNAIRRPWMMLLHLSFVPHSRFEIGGNWGAIFSGSGRPPFTARNFFAMITRQRAIGVAGTEFENQLVSVEARFRPPLPLPAVLYAEWGTEDNHSAWWDVPAIVAGFEVPSVPGVPQLALGFEHAVFDSPCFTCGTRGFPSNWYRHYIYQAGWANDPVPLGHPLGGNGREWLAFGRLDVDDARIRLAGRLFWRDRGYYNLYAPDREGRSVGVGLRAQLRARRSLEVTAEGSYEDGARDWRETTARTGVRWMF